MHISDSEDDSASPVNIKLFSPLVSFIATELLLLSLPIIEGASIVKLPVPKENSVPTDGCFISRFFAATLLIKEVYS